jgi:hypothetical protein
MRGGSFLCPGEGPEGEMRGRKRAALPGQHRGACLSGAAADLAEPLRPHNSGRAGERSGDASTARRHAVRALIFERLVTQS